MANHLVAGFVSAGCRIDVLVLKRTGGHIGSVPTGARVRYLFSRHAALAVPELVLYFMRVRPPVLLAFKDRAGRAAVRAKRLCSSGTKVFVSIGNTISPALQRKSIAQRTLRYRAIRRSYPHADGIIAVSRGVSEDIVATAGVPRSRVHVAPNPVVTTALLRRGAAVPDHAWFTDCRPPILVAVGRLAEQKDFPTLLRAFAKLRQAIGARLLILGEGPQRRILERLSAELGIGSCVDMPGFAERPECYIAHSDALVLSSAWEGSGVVLVEALALGTPVVATDCRSGPREILDDGHYGELVPVGDPQALANAIERTLYRMPSPRILRAGARPYTCANSARRHAEILGLTCMVSSRC